MLFIVLHKTSIIPSMSFVSPPKSPDPSRAMNYTISPMTPALSHSGLTRPQKVSYKATAGLTLHSLPFKRSHQLDQNKMMIQQYDIPLKRPAQEKRLIHRRLKLVGSSSNGSSNAWNPLSASDMIRQLYNCINEKDLKQLDDYLSDECYFEECSFPSPMQGKKEVFRFFEQLARSMGKNVKFSVEHVCEDDESTVGVSWHLEWMKKQIPFTRGCSFYGCSIEEGRLLIKKARIVIESPIKPGGLVLILLKNVTSVFDEFPKATEWFLRSPHVIAQFLLKLYNTFLAPFINPLIEGYLKIWTIMARLFAFALKIIYHIAKIFFK